MSESVEIETTRYSGYLSERDTPFIVNNQYTSEWLEWDWRFADAISRVDAGSTDYQDLDHYYYFVTCGI